MEFDEIEFFGHLDKKEQANMVELSPDGDFAVISTTCFGSNYENYSF